MKKFIEDLYELLELRDTNYEKFMDKLYVMLTEEYSSLKKSDMFSESETELVVRSMIKHFELKEEYEKCDVLLHLINHNK